jgi:hypothetical protein
MKKIFKYTILFLFVLLISCDDAITSEDIDKLIMPDSNVSYAQHIAPVFEVKCVLCHNDSRNEGGINLSSWVKATSDLRIIFPGSDSTSVLVWTIERLPPYPPMPPNQWLVRNHIDGIRTWIREGAKNN